MDLKERAKKLRQDIPIVFLSLKDKDTPIPVKIIAGIAICYALSPIDLIPDCIPVLGYLDDIIILPALIALTVKWIPKEVWERNCVQADNMWQDKKPKKWYYAIPFVVAWVLMFVVLVKAILMLIA